MVTTLSFCFVILSCCLCLQVAHSEDPCKAATFIGHAMRKPSYVTQFTDMELCDSDLDPETWYNLGGDITQSCVSINRCGTYSGIWYNGSYPEDDDIVSGKVCATDDAGNCCAWSSIIKIKKCPDGHVYKLGVPESCPRSYCVGEAVKCLSGEVYYKKSGSCLNVPLIQRPKLSSPYISDSEMIGLFNATAFSIDCIIETIASNKTLPTAGKLKVLTLFKMNDDVIWNSIDDHPIQKVSLDEIHLVGHLGKTLTCEVRFFYEFDDNTFSTKSTEMKSSGYFLGITAMDGDGNHIKELRISQGVISTINLLATFPITARHCFNNKTCVRKYSFLMESSKKGVKQRNCQVYFGNPLGTISYTSSPPIQISSEVKPGTEYSKNFLSFRPYDHVGTKTLFQGYTIAPIQISIEERKTRPTCHSVGDPHFSSFSEAKFDNYFTGDFNLLSTPADQRTFQIQVRQIACGKSGVTCNCGIIAREGNNLVGVNSCDYRKTPLVVELMKDNVNPTASIEKNGDSYNILFVSGVKVDVNPFVYEDSTFFHIYVHGLKYERYDGICAAVEAPKDFNIFRIEYANSFFKSQLPPCVDEVFNFPTCQCDRSESSDVVTKVLINCEFETPNTNLQVIKLNKICDVRIAIRRKKRDIKKEMVILENGSSLEDSRGFTLDDIFNNVNHSRDNDKSPVIGIIDEGRARDICEKVFLQSPNFDKCLEYLKEKFEALKRNCIDDVKLTGNEEIAGSYLTIFQHNCEITLEKHVVITDGLEAPETKRISKILREVKAATCPTCLNGGKCVNGTCVCIEGFSGETCLYEMNKAPHIALVQKNVFCDMSLRSCHLLNLETSMTDPNVTSHMECVVNIIEEQNNIRKVLRMNGSFIQPGYFQCPLDPETFIEGGLRMSQVNMSVYVIKRDGNKELKSNELQWIVFDGACLSCLDGRCRQKEETCLINEVCYKSMHAFDEHHQCNPSLSTAEWSRNEVEDFRPLYWVIITSSLLVMCTVTAILLLKFLPERRTWKPKGISEEGQMLSS